MSLNAPRNKKQKDTSSGLKAWFIQEGGLQIPEHSRVFYGSLREHFREHFSCQYLTISMLSSFMGSESRNTKG